MLIFWSKLTKEYTKWILQFRVYEENPIRYRFVNKTKAKPFEYITVYRGIATYRRYAPLLVLPLLPSLSLELLCLFLLHRFFRAHLMGEVSSSSTPLCSSVPSSALRRRCFSTGRCRRRQTSGGRQGSVRRWFLRSCLRPVILPPSYWPVLVKDSWSFIFCLLPWLQEAPVAACGAIPRWHC